LFKKEKCKSKLHITLIIGNGSHNLWDIHRMEYPAAIKSEELDYTKMENS
jgi:hypothetical protein